MSMEAPGGLPVHRESFVVRAKFLDAHNFLRMTEHFDRYLLGVPTPSRLPVDMAEVEYISSLFAVLDKTFHESFPHALLLMNTQPALREILSFLDLNPSNLLIVPSGACPNCLWGFDAARAVCPRCGPFQTHVASA